MSTSAITTSVDPIVEQKIQIPYSYVAGPAVSQFLLGLKEGVFRASKCSSCGRTTVPPIAHCGRCWKPIEQFVIVGPQAVLESFASVPGEGGQEEVYALVRLNGSDTSLPHRLHLEPGETAKIGAAVEPVWNEQRTGSVLDVRCFRLAKHP